jgi:hypothetical protein
MITDRTIDLNITESAPPEIMYWDGDAFQATGLVISGSGDIIDGGSTVNIENLNKISATNKFFDITHPSKGEPWRLQYGVLEGPENGVFLRGTTTESIITLPDYWVDLVHADSITVQLTPIGNACIHYVVNVNTNQIEINCECGEIHAYYTINAERKDVDPPQIEYIRK